VVLLWLTPLFTHMPQSCPAAIIIVGVTGLFDFGELKYLYHVNPIEILVWLTAFIVTLFAGVEIGLLSSIILSVAVVFYKSAFPRIAILGRLPKTTLYRNVKQYQGLNQEPGILIIRVDAPLFFANIINVRDWIRERIAKADTDGQASGHPVRFVIMDFSPVIDIDGTALHILLTFVDQMKRQGMVLMVANPTNDVMEKMAFSGLVQALGDQGVQVNTHNAVLRARLALKTQETQGDEKSSEEKKSDTLSRQSSLEAGPLTGDDLIRQPSAAGGEDSGEDHSNVQVTVHTFPPTPTATKDSFGKSDIELQSR